MWCFQDKYWSITTRKYLTWSLRSRSKNILVRLSWALMRMLKLMRFWYITEKIHFRKSWTEWNCFLYFQSSLLSQPIKKCVPMKLLIIILLQRRSLRFSGCQIAYVFTGKVYLVFNESLSIDIPLTNRVRGPYRKLRTEFFSPRFMAQARLNRRGKNEDP